MRPSIPRSTTRSCGWWQSAPPPTRYLATVREGAITGDLAATRIKAVVTGRPKHYYSVYQKMIVRGREFEEIYDLVAVRVLVDSVRDCYAVLGALRARWNPVPGVSRTTSRCPSSACTSPCTTVIGPQRKAGRRSRSVRTPCTVRAESTAWRRTGSTRRMPRGMPLVRLPLDARLTPVPSTTWRGCVSCSTGRARSPTPASSWTPCASRSAPPRGLRYSPQRVSGRPASRFDGS